MPEPETDLEDSLSGESDLDESPIAETKTADSQVVTRPLKELLVIFVGLSLAVFLASLDQTIVATALPTIASDFQSLNNIAWVATSYLLTSTAFQPLYGKFSDIFGRKATMMFALGSFLIGSALCGASQNMSMMIGSRAVAGLGGGGLMSMVQIIISDIVSLRDRGKYTGIIGAVFTLSTVVGPLLGGFFTDKVSWRWAFYINLPIGLFTVIAIVFFLKLPSPGGDFLSKVKRIDWLGTLLLVCATVCVLLAMSWGGSDYPWGSAMIIGLFVAGGVFTLIFCFVERNIALEPITPGHLFLVRNVVTSYIFSFFVGICLFGFMFYVPLYFQVIRDYSATDAGLQLLPLMIALIVFSIGSGIIITKTGKFRWMIVSGSALLLIACGLVSTWNIESTRGMEIGYLAMVGAGIGFCFQPILIAAQAAVKHRDIAVVTAIISFFRTIGGVLGIAICGSIFNNSIDSELHRQLEGVPGITPQLFEALKLNVAVIAKQPPFVVAAVKQAYADALDTTFTVTIPVAALAFTASLFLEHLKIKKTKRPDVIME